MTDLSVEEILRLNAERYRALIAALAEIVWIADARGQMAGDQPGWQAYTGQTSAEIQGTGWLAAGVAFGAGFSDLILLLIADSNFPFSSEGNRRKASA